MAVCWYNLLVHSCAAGMGRRASSRFRRGVTGCLLTVGCTARCVVSRLTHTRQKCSGGEHPENAPQCWPILRRVYTVRASFRAGAFRAAIETVRLVNSLSIETLLFEYNCCILWAVHRKEKKNCSSSVCITTLWEFRMRLNLLASL